MCFLRKNFIILFLIFFSFGANSNYINGTYKCRMSAWSPFKTTLILENFKLKYENDGQVDRTIGITIDGYIDGKRLKPAPYRSDILVIEFTKKIKRYIYVGYDTEINREPNEGVRYIYKEKEFSETKGTRWVKKRDVYCEKQ